MSFVICAAKTEALRGEGESKAVPETKHLPRSTEQTDVAFTLLSTNGAYRCNSSPTTMSAWKKRPHMKMSSHTGSLLPILPLGRGPLLTHGEAVASAVEWGQEWTSLVFHLAPEHAGDCCI